MLDIIIGLLALASALSISSVAIYFSVAGLAAIFSAYAASIIVMGTTIEVGKLVAVTWLHYNWKDKNRLLRNGLIVIVAGVMFITSMGIFGYLSKSHVEQTAQSQESVAQVQRIENEIARNTAVIARSEEKIKGYESNGSGVDASLNAQIDKEQARIDSAYDRVKPVIQVQRDIIATEEAKVQARTKPFQEELDAINKQLSDLQTALNNKEIRIAQGIVGTKPDGSYGSKTQAAIKEFRTRNESRRNELLQKIDGIRGNPSSATKAAQEEITRIRASVQAEIDESNATISKLRTRMGQSNANDIETLITAERDKIKNANAELDSLTEKKYQLQADYRKLEAEVGPIKYIAEFVADQEADTALLERAVQWLIILIIFVFDPFAVLLLIAAQHSFDKARDERKERITKKADDIGKLVTNVETALHNAEKVEQNLEKMIQELPEYDDHIEHVDEELETTIAESAIQKTNVISLIKVANNYINYNGKSYQVKALQAAHPELHLDLDKQVKSGKEYPLNPIYGELFLRTDIEPTRLFIYNGQGWDAIDKNILNFSAYSHEYIKALIKRIGNGEYNPQLLNEHEKKHIEDLLGNE